MLGSGTVVSCPDVAFEGIGKLAVSVEEIAHVVVTHSDALFDQVCLQSENPGQG